MNDQFEVVVLGGGGIGSAAFFHAARLGRNVLALEQFSAAHDRGSSHGETRIIRQAYFEHPDYVPLLRESYGAWRELERLCQKTLFFETGLLEVGFPDGPIIQGILRSAEQHQLPIEKLSDAELAQRLPMFRKPADQVALFERNAGYLLVEACVQAHLDAAVAAGGEWRPNTNVHEIQPHKHRVRISTSRGEIFAERLIVTAGAWTGELLPWLQPLLEVRRKHQYWFRLTDPRFRADAGCPTYFFETDDGHFYGFPALAEGLTKVARHSGGSPVADPTHVDRALEAEDLAKVQSFVWRYLNTPVGQLARHAVCMYTMTRDEHFIIDRHPEISQIVFCAGLSGHGFKFAPVLGRYLNELSEGRTDPRFEFLKSSRPALANRIKSAI